jgi:hypothetical protein
MDSLLDLVLAVIETTLGIVLLLVVLSVMLIMLMLLIFFCSG